MASLFRKSISDLTPDDIEELVARQYAENQVFEIKGHLPSRDGLDQWEIDQTRIGDRAKVQIAQEIVAFANAEGGWLVLGLEESADDPKRASEIVPLARCAALAQRLEDIFRNIIEPIVPLLEVRGIEIGGTPDQGVVVVRVPPSVVAPHRLDISGVTRDAYIRRNAKAERMTMREIQDRTLEAARGLEAIEQRFAEFAEAYTTFRVGGLQNHEIQSGFRISIVPLRETFQVTEIYRQQELFELSLSHRAFLGTTRLDVRTVYANREVTRAIRPILRGGLLEWFREGRSHGWLEARSGGAVNYVVKVIGDRGYLNTGWIAAELASALLVADRVRIAGNNPESELAIDIEVRADLYDEGARLERPRELRLGPLGEEDVQGDINVLPNGLRLPRYRVGGRIEFSQTAVDVVNDLYNATGRASLNDLRMEI